MNIKCFSDLEKWMQGIVDQVKVATGTPGAVSLQFESWHYTTGDRALRGQVWVAEHDKHYHFKTYRELCGLIEQLDDRLLYREFEL